MLAPFVTDPYAGSIAFPYADGMFPDGTPVPPHTYDQTEYHPGSNSLLVMRTMEHNAPNNVPVAVMFSFDTLSWPPEQSYNGVFSRFRLVRYDDAEFAVAVTNVDTPVYAFRLSR